MSTDGGELLVRTLKQADVACAFVLHGGHLDPIFQASLDHSIRLIDTRHEAAAGHAADAYARQTGRVGVAIATAGPGFTNILTAITQCYLDASPVLFVVGAAPLRDVEVWPLQGGIDQVAMAKPVTKWAGQATRTEQIPHLVAHAIRTAMTGRPGPVLLEVPIDVLFNRHDAKVEIPQTIQPDTAPAPSQHQVKQAIERLKQAERPIMVLGGGCLFSGAAEALRGFAEASGIPVYANNKALGILPIDHPLSGYSLTNLGVLQASDNGKPDAALLLGARFGMFTQGDKLLPGDCQLIQVDVNGAELGRLRPVDLPIQADCRETLLALTQASQDVDWPDWRPWLETVHQHSHWHEAAYAEAASRAGQGIHPYRAMTEILSVLDDDTILCADGGETSLWAELCSQARTPGQYTGHGYLGCLGIGMPFAMGSQIAHPARRVVCVVGDGAVGMNIQEFDTMVRHELPIVTIVLNNKAWGMCVHGQQAMYGGNRLVVTTLGEGRYDRVAEGFGCFWAYVEKAGDIAAAVTEALAAKKPACINILTDLDAAYGDLSGVALVDQEAEQTDGATPEPKDSETEIEMPYYDNLQSD